jgi:ATP-binding cassette subfamily B protein
VKITISAGNFGQFVAAFQELTGCTGRCDGAELTLHWPQQTGEGYYRWLRLRGGIELFICDYQLHQPITVDSGAIRIGGVDVREMATATLQAQIGLVFQDVYLFRDSVLNNIRLGCPDATAEQVIAAAKAACAHDFITELPQGYDTLLGEGGYDLSGGQRPRLSIARALLKDAPILILDEATASVDLDNEQLIQQAIAVLARGRTVIVIAHRLWTIQHADQILYFEGGRIVERGTHAELLAIEKNGRYRRQWQAQQQARGWRIGGATGALPVG